MPDFLDYALSNDDALCHLVQWVVSNKPLTDYNQIYEYVKVHGTPRAKQILDKGYAEFQSQRGAAR